MKRRKDRTTAPIHVLPLLVLACASQPSPPSTAPNALRSSSGVRDLTSAPIASLKAEDKNLVATVERLSQASDGVRRKALSKRLIALGLEVQSSTWIEERRDLLARANTSARLAPTQKQFEAQLVAWQTETLDRVFSAMRYAIAADVWPFALAIASNDAEPLPRRKAALGLLDWHTPISRPDSDARETARSAVSRSEQAMLNDPQENLILVVSSMRSGFRHCYNTQLARDPTGDLEGKVVFSIHPAGSVGSVSVEGLPTEMRTCIEFVASKAKFLPTNAEKPVVVTLPMRFTKQ